MDDDGIPISWDLSSEYSLNRNYEEENASHTPQGIQRLLSAGHLPSTKPLIYLRDYLSTRKSNCSVYELIRCHSNCWKNLPENAKSGTGSEHDDLVETTSRLVKSSYDSILDLLPASSGVSAIIDGTSRRALSQSSLSKFIRNFTIPGVGTGADEKTVTLALPNGPLLGLLSLAVATHYILAPINVSSGAEQFKSDILSTGSKTVLVLEAYIHLLSLDEEWITDSGIEVYIVNPTQDMTCTISAFRKSTSTSRLHTRPNGPDDICMILFTSGTTGTKKIVPINLHSIISAVAFVGESWRLTHEDVCLNMMPLIHVGGLVRNLFAPVLLGGSTICCSAFDPNLFWDLVLENSATWYYASPSMHSVILDEAPNPKFYPQKSRMRMVCNAAGGLLPSLATRLRDTFNCPVLPSYGMTECMPISTPPINYELERTGTSGVSVGPELAILDNKDRKECPGRVGRICVRGNPVFSGYIVNGKIDKSAFTTDGWFDTGDLGYLDNDGYLYITGRSKEVINRGGEIISPFEIEEAIMNATRKEGSQIRGRISKSLAFSVSHNSLQETVGVILVVPPGEPRPDLRQLHDAVKLSLHPTKWPAVLVYMDAIPERNGKPCRVRLGERLNFVSMRDGIKMMERHFEAICPPSDTAINVEIEKTHCQMDGQRVINTISSHYEGRTDVMVKTNPVTGFLDVILAPKSPLLPINKLDVSRLKAELQRNLPGYLIPGKVITFDVPFPRDMLGSIDLAGLENISSSNAMPSMDSSRYLESRVREIYANLLGLPLEDIQPESDFFQLGGDSLNAGRLLSVLRREFNSRVPIDKLFTSSRVTDICTLIDEHQPTTKKENSDCGCAVLPSCAKSCSSTGIFTLIIHLLPLAVFSPFRKALLLTIFLNTWSLTLKYWPRNHTNGNLMYLIVSMVVARVALAIFMPLIVIMSKWVIIGRYKEGLYPMWSAYHNRWWLVSKISHVFGMGMFKHFNWSRIVFYRLLGAKIGRGVRIEPNTTLGEYDLLDIEDYVQLDRCVCRPFAVERNTAMYLGKIRLGRNSAAGLGTIIAPGTDLPDNTCLGVSSSSWELQDANGSNYNRLASSIPEPHWLLWGLLGMPILAMVKIVSLLPWIGGLNGLKVSHPPEGADLTLFLLSWFANPTRVGFHFLTRTLNVVFAPIVYLMLTVILKYLMDTIFGKIQPGLSVQRRHIDRFRMALLSRLIPNGNISEVTSFFGTHYEITSIIIRALGGKVGKRVYWPGNGPSIQNFDLIDIGDDVVFGSRAHIMTSDGIGCDSVRIDDGAMVADRVVMLPGCEVGNQALLGSGTLTRRNARYASNSIWIGSKAGGPICLSTSNTHPSSLEYQNNCLSSGLQKSNPDDGSQDLEEKFIAYNSITERYSTSSESSCSSTNLSSLFLDKSSQPTFSTSITPFGRAFYEKQASYRVLGLSTIVFYSFFINIFISIFWNVPTILSLQLLSKIANKSLFSHLFTSSPYRPFLILSLLFVSFSILQVVFSVLSLAICIFAKWSIIGQRVPGDYDWDKSSYCQRWNILLTIEHIRRNQVGGEDVLSLLTGTFYCSLYFRFLGAKIGKDCAIFAGGEISLTFTEPDLLTLGDRVAVDDVSLVSHINSRGNFKLNPLVVGDRCVLRTGSRLLSGAKMRDDSCLLEHTLVMAGDEIENGTTYQGWPADEFVGARVRVEETTIDGEEEKKMVRGMKRTSGLEAWRWLKKDRHSVRYERLASTSESSELSDG